MIAAVGARAAENQIANHALFEVVPSMRERLQLDRIDGERVGNDLGNDFFLEGSRRIGSGLLAAGLLGRAELVVEAALEQVIQPVAGRRLERRFLNADFLRKLALQ